MGTTRHGSGEESEEEFHEDSGEKCDEFDALETCFKVLSPLCSWKAESKFNEDIGERRYIVVKREIRLTASHRQA